MKQYKYLHNIFVFLLILTFINIVKFIISSYKFMLKPKNLTKIYGKKSWIVITGASSGQGKQYAIQFAQKGFNILLIGSKKCFNVEKIINTKFPNVQTKVILKDFSLANEENFFHSVKNFIVDKDVSGFVSNVAYRYGINQYHLINDDKINKIIITKGITQSKLIKLALETFIERKKKSFIIVISALSLNKCGIYNDNVNTLPFVSIYEGINAFAFCHANSIFKEINLNKKYNHIDFLNITPAAVITSNTKPFLKNAILSVNDDYFVKSSIKLLNNFNGTTCGCIEHLLASFLPTFLPIKIFEDMILFTIGKKISQYYKNK